MVPQIADPVRAADLRRNHKPQDQRVYLLLFQRGDARLLFKAAEGLHVAV